MVDLHQQVAARQGWIGYEGCLARRVLRELHVAPALRAVHIDNARRRPDPIVFRQLGNFEVLAVDDVVLPFDPREVDPPLVAVIGRAGPVRVLGQGLPGNGNFHAPALVLVGRIVQGSLDVDRSLHAGELKAVVCLAAVLIRAGHEEVPGRIEGVQFEFVIVVVIAVRIDEHLEVVVLKDYCVVLLDRGQYVRLLQLSGDIEVVVVPEHLGPGAEAGLWLLRPLDVQKLLGPGGGLPSRIIELPVDHGWLAGETADVATGSKLLHLCPVFGGAGHRESARAAKTSNAQPDDQTRDLRAANLHCDLQFSPNSADG